MCVCLNGTCGAEESDPDLLVVKGVHWGFDSTIQEGMFVPFSVQLQNAIEIPWTGKLTLSRGTSSAGLGIDTEMEVTLQPNEERWVQFVPLVVDKFEDWTLRWGPKKNHTFAINNIQSGPRPTVLVTNPDAVSVGASVLRTLPEELFPTSVVATESLRGLVLDRSPFWQGARAQAFTEWLHAGGRVYILRNDKSVFPSFHKPLAYLNSDQQRFSIGRGDVIRIPLQASEVTLDIARTQIFNDDNSRPVINRIPSSNQYEFSSSWNRYRDLFSELRPLAVFQRRWSVIYLAAFAYLGVLLYCYRIGRREEQVRWFYSAFFASVVLFSLIFISLGQLGASVQNRLRITSLVHHIHDDFYEVTDWGTVANVNAGEYEVAFDGTGRCFSTCSDMEKVNGKIEYGRNSSIVFDMPPATRRTFMQKRRIARSQPRPKLAIIDSNMSNLEDFAVSVQDCFEHDILKSYVVYRSQIYPLELDSGVLQLVRKGTLGLPRQADLQTELSRISHWQYTQKNPLFRIHSQYDDDEEYSHHERYEAMLKPLIGNSFGFVNQISARKLNLGANTARLFVYTEAPESLQANTSDFPDQSGTALFVFDYKTQ